MSEAAAKVRLVCCPKCENLLPEVTDYHLYQCGGCGAVLRAKNKGVESDSLSEKSGEGSDLGVSDKLSVDSNYDFTKRRVKKLSIGSENDVKSNSSSTRKSEEDNNGSVMKIDKYSADSDAEMEKNTEEMNKLKLESEVDDVKLQTGSRNGSRRSVRSWRSGEKGKTQGNYSEEGPSKYSQGSVHEYAELVKSRNGPEVEYVEDDRAELLRKLDELREQITRSHPVVGRSKEQVPMESRIPVQYPVTRQPPFMANYAEMGMHSLHPSLHPSNQVPVRVQGYGDPYSSQLLRRATPQPPITFEQKPYHPYFPGQYAGNDLAEMDMLHHPSCSCYICYNKHHQQAPPPIPPSDLPNQPFFSANGFAPQREYDYSRNAIPRFPNLPPVNNLLSNPKPNTRWSNDLLNTDMGSGLAHHRPQRVLLPVGGRRCHPVAGGSPFVACCNCFELLQVPNMKKAQKKMRCAACSEVILFSILNKKLVLSIYSEPKRHSENNKDTVAVNGGGLHTHGHPTWASTEFSSVDYDNSAYEFQSMDRLAAGPSLASYKSTATESLQSTSSASSEYEDIKARVREPVISAYEFQSMDRLVAGPSLASYKSTATESLQSTSSASSEYEDIKARVREPVISAEVKPSPPPSGSPLQELFDYSTKYNRGKGNRSERTDLEKFIPSEKDASRQNSMKDASVATEMEISSNEFSVSTGTFQHSGDSRDEDQLRSNRGSGDSFFAGIKKSFREFSKSNSNSEQEKINVTVNGQPLPDRLVRKAEKLAGPIQPGDYWYDSRAGFWGVLGGPCRGIIPPFIEEFNHPMPEHCAGGNTGIFVNGRELHQRDLDMLASRGLPRETQRSYIIEISGRVIDDDTGKELDSLGKLAPTVERKKRGFGMKPPRSSTQLNGINNQVPNRLQES